MNKISQKKNLSSMQVLKTLQVLLEGDYTMQELMKKLNAGKDGVVYNNSVISKYINTCRYCGIEIPKIQNKYIVASIPFGLKLDDVDISLLKEIQSYIKEYFAAKYLAIFNKFAKKLNRFSDRKIARVEKEDYVFSIELFERAVSKKCVVKLIFKNREELDCLPLKVIKQGDKTFFSVYNKRERLIDTSRLSGIRISDEKFVEPYNYEQTVVFKLKGKLAKRYQIRKDIETLMNVDSVSGDITIVNRGERKEELFARFLRYEDDCEIINPKSYREEMKEILTNALKNYEV